MGWKMSSVSQYSTDLDKNAANYTPLSPLTFIERAAAVYPARAAIIYREFEQSWAETYRRCRRLPRRCAGMASGLTTRLL
jgi:fatty-acyl-CoA synthase